MQPIDLDSLLWLASWWFLAACLAWGAYEAWHAADRALRRAERGAHRAGRPLPPERPEMPGRVAVPGFDDIGSLCLPEEQEWLAGHGGARWASDMDSGDLPAWAEPGADRVGTYGVASGAAGRGDYGRPPWEDPEPGPGPEPPPAPATGEELPGQAPAFDPEFDQAACTCYHPPSAHDDGFGCTIPECDCLAGWSWTVASLAELATAPTVLDPAEPTRFDAELAAQVAGWVREQDAQTRAILSGLGSLS